MPTTARSLASITVSQPASRMRWPPTPKNSSEGSRRRRASMSCAPYISPEASPAEIRIRTKDIVMGSRAIRMVCTAELLDEENVGNERGADKEFGEKQLG